jgi:SAM-dependent methyltransferase
MASIYETGQYMELNPSYHVQDSPWKARQIAGVINRHSLRPRSVAELGCGAGAILGALSKQGVLESARFFGYDISPKAIELARRTNDSRITFLCQDLLSPENAERFDLLLVVDVVEHVPDYLGFLARCRPKAEHKIFHIPLDLHVSALLRNSFMAGRYSVGHLHYFTADSAIATLKDSGYEILESAFTNPAIDLFRQSPTVKKGLANIPRWAISRFSTGLAARLLGGYSLLVLAR